MRRGLILLAVGALACFASLASCDDDSGPKPVKAEKRAASGPAARLGPGWHATADARISAWGFAPQPNTDPVASIRSAIDAGALPPRGAVRLAPLIQHFAVGLPAPEPDST